MNAQIVLPPEPDLTSLVDLRYSCMGSRVVFYSRATALLVVGARPGVGPEVLNGFKAVRSMG
jgi:hypothetical protein